MTARRRHPVTNPPGSYIMYSHMLHQRNKVYGKSKQQ